jgi:hypothetical protein
MIVYCRCCSAQNFISAERLAVREVPPRCWECGRELVLSEAGADAPGETGRERQESKRGNSGEKKDGSA